METENSYNERTPLLGNGSTSNQLGQTTRIPISNESTPLVGNGSDSNEKKLSLAENIASNLETQPMTSPKTIERETNEVSLEQIVEAVVSIWKQHKQPYPRDIDENDLDFFSTKELYAMTVAWNRVTKENECSIETSDIAEALGSAMVKELYPELEEIDNTFFEITKKIMTVNFLKNWNEITQPTSMVPVRYTETIFKDPEESQPTVSQFCLRQVELYDKIHDYVVNPKFQVLLHSLLITWPVSLLIIGSKYMECVACLHVSRLLITLGCIGCLAVVYRLTAMYFSYQRIISRNRRWHWRWKGLRLIEFIFFIVFIIQAFLFFSNHQTNEPDPTKCAENFYILGLVINCVSIALVSIYVLTYSVIICSHYFDAWHWFFRYF